MLKSDKETIRICGDFKQTVNSASKVDCYPLPKAEDIFATLAGRKVFISTRRVPKDHGEYFAGDSTGLRLPDILITGRTESEHVR